MLRPRNVGLATRSFGILPTAGNSTQHPKGVSDSNGTAIATTFAHFRELQTKVATTKKSARAPEFLRDKSLASSLSYIAALIGSRGGIVTYWTLRSFHEFRTPCIASKNQG